MAERASEPTARRPGKGEPRRALCRSSKPRRAGGGSSPNMRGAAARPRPTCCSKRSGGSKKRCSGRNASRHPQTSWPSATSLAEAIANTRRKIARIKPPHRSPTRRSLARPRSSTASSRPTERATSEILEAAEDIQEVAWTMREKSVKLGPCDKIDRRATDIVHGLLVPGYPASGRRGSFVRRASWSSASTP